MAGMIVKSSPPVVADEILKSAGILMQNAACNEAMIFAAFVIFSKIPNDMAMTIFYSVDNLQGKKNLLNRVIDTVGGDQQDKDLVKAITDAAEKSAKKRNALAHSFLTWESMDENCMPKLMHPKSKKHEEISRGAMDAYLQESRNAFSEGARALEQLGLKHGRRSVLADK